MPIYFARFVGGLQRFVHAEIEQKLNDIGVLDQGKEHIVFRCPGNPKPLLQLRSVEEVYLCLRYLEDVSRSRTQLRRITTAARAFDYRQAATIAQQMGLRWRGPLRIRVRASMRGRHNFRRVDAQYAVEHGLLSRHDLRCRLDKSHPHVEIRIEIQEESAYLLWKLTDERFRQHGEKHVHLPASLRPTVAYAMVQESQSSPDDVFLDPMCGAGTILLERAHSRSYRYLLGGDIEWRAVQATRANIGLRYEPFALFWWNALELPLEERSVDRIVCNLPFGKQIALPYPAFYSDFLRQARCIVRPDGRIVLLVSDKQRLVAAIKDTHWKIRKITPISLLGQRSFMISFQPRPVPPHLSGTERA